MNDATDTAEGQETAAQTQRQQQHISPVVSVGLAQDSSDRDRFALQPLQLPKHRHTGLKAHPFYQPVIIMAATTATTTTAPAAAPVKKARPLIIEFGMAGAATSTAVLFTNPIEVVKTRFQVQGELGGTAARRQYNNMFHALLTISREEGVRGLQGGLAPAVAYQVMMNGTRLGLYAPVQRLYSTWFSTPLHQRPVDTLQQQQQQGKAVDVAAAVRPNMFINVAAGTTSGVAGAFVGSPFFLMKVRLQVAQSKAAAAATAAATTTAAATATVTTGVQHHYSSAASGLLHIYQTEGIRGCFRGVQAAMLRVGMGSGVQLATYDNNKHLLMNTLGLADGVAAHAAASMMTGVVVTCVMNPADVVSTRLYNQPVVNGVPSYYTGVIDCALKTYRSEGVLAFYKGLLPHYLRLGPHTILTFVFWEQTKRWADKLKL